MKPLKVAVIGAGAAGYFTAAAIKHNVPNVEVEIYYDPKIKHIGVGESLGFSAKNFFKDTLGLDNEDWMTESQSTHKLGIRFYGWNNSDKPWYMGPGAAMFSNFTNREKGYTIEDIWFDLYKKGERRAEDYHYDFPFALYCANRVPLNRQQHSYHINVEYIRETVHNKVGKPAGVIERPIPVKEVVVKDNAIDYLLLDDNTELRADLYIDCTGFQRLMVNKLPFEFTAYPDHFNNCAIVGPHKYEDESEFNRPWTDHYAMDWGWSFSVPLAQRSGEGYIFNKNIYNGDVDRLVSEWETKRGMKNTIGRVISWEPGHCKNIMVGNCVVIGLGFGMLDAFDANVFTTTMKFITRLVDHLKQDDTMSLNWREQYNAFARRAVDDIELRINTGFHLAPKNDTPYWQYMKEAGKKFDTLNKSINTLFTEERRFRPLELYTPQYSLIEFLVYYGVDLSVINKPRSDYTLFTEQQALNMFKTVNKIHRSMDLSNCDRLLPRRSSMDRIALS